MRTKPHHLLNYSIKQLILKAYLMVKTGKTAVSGFKATGIYPLNHNIIPESVFLVSEIKQYKGTSSMSLGSFICHGSSSFATPTTMPDAFMFTGPPTVACPTLSFVPLKVVYQILPQPSLLIKHENKSVTLYKITLIY
jgi:hypothetical protein